MVISDVKQVSQDCVKITVDAGPSFFIRVSYLHVVTLSELFSFAEFTGDREEDILDAGMTYSAERKAVDYLSRAEQCRFVLSRKLEAKGFEHPYVDRALDFLESRKYLSDERFAEAWLNNRKSTKFEGRRKLEAELAARGINRNIIRTILDNFFSNTSEEELCCRALDKCRRQGKNEEQTTRYLFRQGFSYRLIESLLLKTQV